MGTENLNCEELKKKLTESIEKINCDNKNENYEILELYKAIVLNEPLPPAHKLDFTSNFESKFSLTDRQEIKDRFCLDKSNFLSVLQNTSNKYLRIYFIDEKTFNPLSNSKLGLLLRFTEKDYITVSNMNNITGEEIYILDQVTCELKPIDQLASKPNDDVLFTEIRKQFHKTLGDKIKQNTGIYNITECTRYLVGKIPIPQIVDEILEIDVICFRHITGSTTNYMSREDRLGLSFKVNSGAILSYLDAGLLEP